MVSVYFCDYGDLALFEPKALRPIPAGAPLARTLPPQAIKARLYGKCFLQKFCKNELSYNLTVQRLPRFILKEELCK